MADRVFHCEVATEFTMLHIKAGFKSILYIFLFPSSETSCILSSFPFLHFSWYNIQSLFPLAFSAKNSQITSRHSCFRSNQWEQRVCSFNQSVIRSTPIACCGWIGFFPRFLQFKFFFEFWLAHWLKKTGIRCTCLWMHITFRLQLSPSVPKKKPKKKSPVKKRGRLEAVYRSQNRKSGPRKTVSTVKERKRSASASPVLGRKKSDSPGELFKIFVKFVQKFECLFRLRADLRY